MIGLDTNVVVRYLAHDDAKQSAAARLFEQKVTQEEPGSIAAIEGLLAVKQIAVEAPAEGAAKTVTFDRAAAKLPGFELL